MPAHGGDCFAAAAGDFVHAGCAGAGGGSAGEGGRRCRRLRRRCWTSAAELAGVGPFTAEQKKMMLDGLNDQRDGYAADSRAEDDERCAAGVCVSSGEGGGAVARQIVREDCGKAPGRRADWTTASIADPGSRRPGIEDLAFATIDRAGQFVVASARSLRLR